MASVKEHLILNNPKGQKNHFDASRGYTPPEVEEKPASAYRPQKDKFNKSLSIVTTARIKRKEARTLDLPLHLEYIEIHFFTIFNDNDVHKTRTRFKDEYGLIPVNYLNFNQSVIFLISDEYKFLKFIKLLNDFIISPDTKHPLHEPYALATIMYDFEFLDSKKIVNSIGTDILATLVNKTPESTKQFEIILESLKNFLDNVDDGIIEYVTDEESTIQIKNINRKTLSTLVNNFDILAGVQCLRVPGIKPNEFNVPELAWKFKAVASPNAVIVGVLDNGVKPIEPIAGIMVESTIDITNITSPNPFKVEHDHGTVVACLVAMGMDYFDTAKNEITADARIFPIKILNFSKGYFNIYDIQASIIEGYKKGVRIFNLSVCGPSKNYNSAISEYAFILDRLSYQLDILIFIATGNLDIADVVAMKNNPIQFHKYPNHFYNPNKFSDEHMCDGTNLCIPAESYNNITVGALAENLRAGTKVDMSLDKELPAYYTRKHYLDYSKTINGTDFSDSQKNYNINKPDILMPGGDLLNDQSAMQVPGLGINGDDFYTFQAGTSLATPLATNLAAKILNVYPSLGLQSLKALLINSSEMKYSDIFLKDLITEIRNEEARKRFKKRYALLDEKQTKKINSLTSTSILYRHLVGAGTPSLDNLLYSNEKSLTALIEDSIPIDTYKVINLNIPKYLATYSKASPILKIKATICFKFPPVAGNALNYNPLHISFNIANSVEKNNPSKTADILSNRDHSFFNKFYTPEMKPDKKANARAKALGVKTALKPWSEDFYPRTNKPFSNSQNFEIDINKAEIIKVKYQIAIAIRCTIKTDIDKDILDILRNRSHAFSIALTISEKENNELADYSLYDELLEINDFLSIEDLFAEDDLEL